MTTITPRLKGDQALVLQPELGRHSGRQIGGYAWQSAQLNPFHERRLTKPRTRDPTLLDPNFRSVHLQTKRADYSPRPCKTPRAAVHHPRIAMDGVRRVWSTQPCSSNLGPVIWRLYRRCAIANCGKMIFSMALNSGKRW